MLSCEVKFTVYAPFSHLLTLELLGLMGTFCLDKAIALGVLLLFKAISQHSRVSLISAGLNTFKFGILSNQKVVQWVDELDHLHQDQLSHVKRYRLLLDPSEQKV